MKYISIIFIYFFLITAAGRVYAFDLLKEFNIHGFLETDASLKFKSDKTKHDSYNMLEQRLQLETSYYPKDTKLADWYTEFSFKGDFTVDEYYAGKTDFNLRQANVFFSPFSSIDIRAGRQILTWGTGDYIFINDLFPKDYESFFIGREDEYLKIPSDAAKLSFYNSFINTDFVLIPFFQGNNLPKGDRLSFFDTFSGAISGRDSDMHIIEPPTQAKNSEIGLRAYRHFKSYEAAFYFFRGFYKSPLGYKNELNRQIYYPRVDVYGSSIRGPFLSGIGNAEFGFYNSREDSDGGNRLIENSSIKFLIGYQKDLGDDLRVGLQYFYEQTLDYNNLKQALLPNDIYKDERRHLLTFRVTKLLVNQTIKISLFNFYSPTDNDIYIRPSIGYDFNDNLNITWGANLMWGEDDNTEFGQMEQNSNLYLRVRYSF